MKLSLFLVVSTAGLWVAANANSVNSKQTKNDVCTHPFVDINGRCLFVNNFAQMDWDAARAFCGGFQGDLVTLDEANLLADIVDFIYKEGLTDRSYWIGGSASARAGAFVWPDGSLVRMGTPCWGVLDSLQQPGAESCENCIALNRDNFFFFNNFNCEREISVICEYKFQREN
ncbi:galactose-specific lectin nattectin-like [Penaeus chinensis]|uniref:galactose-specific lectin nattectin-like n=1 Tax=Penaeus chinensis TaxID=139456 RepID=UPI001FB5CF11|nr:galactose-specific lectin nattectin-like [Penaeus chinensis]